MGAECGTMSGMRMQWVAVSAGALLGLGCGRHDETPDPQTPQEMYELVQKLLQPNSEHDASDFGQAMVWLRRAAEGGLLQAQTDLGGIYLQGGKGGVKPDGKEAYHWFERAAEQGSAEAHFYLGLILQSGLDMPKDEAKGMEHWQYAAEHGVAEAQLALGRSMVARGEAAEGVRWLVQAASAPVPAVAAQAACALGNVYAKGRDGVPQDMAEAARWYELAARGGDASAQLVYALMLLQPEESPLAEDREQGMRFLRMAAGQDYPQAIAVLVNVLRNRVGGDEAEREAEAWSERLEMLR